MERPGTTWRTPALTDLAGRLDSGPPPRAVVLVEGESDRHALETLARRRGRDLDDEGVLIEPMGGATTLMHFLALVGPDGHDLRLAGLCDRREEAAFQRALEIAGVGHGLDRPSMEALGFFVCDLDLEEELIRALGVEKVVEVIDSDGELATFNLMRRQPAQRERPIEAQLHRFLGTRSGRKYRYAGLLVEALDLDNIPPPLDGVLASVWMVPQTPGNPADPG
jgi:hypothetical protein